MTVVKFDPPMCLITLKDPITTISNKESKVILGQIDSSTVGLYYTLGARLGINSKNILSIEEVRDIDVDYALRKAKEENWIVAT